jgi:hypothetical protein
VIYKELIYIAVDLLSDEIGNIELIGVVVLGAEDTTNNECNCSDENVGSDVCGTKDLDTATFMQAYRICLIAAMIDVI